MHHIRKEYTIWLHEKNHYDPLLGWVFQILCSVFYSKGRKNNLSIFTAELIGTFVLVFIGNNSVAQKIAQEGNVLDINIAYG